MGGASGRVSTVPFFVVGDVEAIEEGAEQVGVFADEPDLQDVGGDGVVLRAAEGGLHPGEALEARFALHEDGAELALLGQGVDGGFVELLFLAMQVAENLGGGGGGHGDENFVGVHEWSGVGACGFGFG